MNWGGDNEITIPEMLIIHVFVFCKNINDLPVEIKQYRPLISFLTNLFTHNAHNILSVIKRIYGNLSVNHKKCSYKGKQIWEFLRNRLSWPWKAVFHIFPLDKYKFLKPYIIWPPHTIHLHICFHENSHKFSSCIAKLM